MIMKTKNRVCAVFAATIMTVLSCAPAAYAAETQRELFAGGNLINTEISVQSPSICEINYINGDTEHSLGKMLHIGVNGCGYSAYLRFSNSETIDLSKKKDFSLFFKTRDVNSAFTGQIRPALLMKAKSNPDIEVAVPISNFLNVYDYPLVNEGVSSTGFSNSWNYISVPVEDFDVKGRFYDATQSIGEPDPACGGDARFRLLEGDFTQVLGVVFLCNAWSMTGELGPHYYNFISSDIRIVKDFSQGLDKFTPEIYDILGNKVSDIKNVPGNPTIKLYFNSDILPGQLNQNSISFSDGTKSFKITSVNGENVLTFDETLDYETQYTLIAKAGIYDVGGNRLEEDCEFTFTTQKAPEITLLPPENLILQNVGYTYAQFSWDVVDGAQEYYIYRDGVHIGRIVENSYTDTDLVSGNTYVYSVRAVNSVEAVISELSNQLEVKTKELLAPNGFFAVENADYVMLAWDTYTGDIDGFNIYRNGELFDELPADILFYQDQGISAGVEYTYLLTAVKDGVESPAASTTVKIPAVDVDTRVLFKDGAFRQAEGSGWGGATCAISEEKGIHGTTKALKITVPAYGGAEIQLSSNLNLSDKEARENTYLSFWVKANANGSATGKVRLNCLDSSKNESPIQLTIDSGEWKRYSLPISSFSDYGMKYEGGEYKKKQMYWEDLQYIGFYAGAQAVEFLLDDVRIDKGVPQIGNIEFFDKDKNLVPARADNIPVNVKYIDISFSAPVDNAIVSVIGAVQETADGKSGVVYVKKELINNGYTLHIEMPSLKYGCQYAIQLPPELASIPAYGKVVDETLPDSTMDDATFLLKLMEVSFDATAKLAPKAVGTKQTIEVKATPVPIKVTNCKLYNENGQISTEGSVIGNVYVKADLQNISSKSQNANLLMLLYRENGEIMHCVKMRTATAAVGSGKTKTAFTDSITIPEDGAEYRVVVFIYDNLSDMHLYFGPEGIK